MDDALYVDDDDEDNLIELDDDDDDDVFVNDGYNEYQEAIMIMIMIIIIDVIMDQQRVINF